MTGNPDAGGRERLPQDVEQPETGDDALLDEALDETFPASDPVSVGSTGEPDAPRCEDEIDRPTGPDEGR